MAILKLLEACLSLVPSLVRQPKASRLRLRRYSYCLSPDQGQDHHYYRYAPIRDWRAEDGMTSVSIVVSSRTSSSSSSSETLRMMILSSSSGLRTSRLSSSKSLLVNSASRKVSWMRPSSSEDEERSTTGAFPEGPPYSNIGECGRREETSGRDPSGGGDLEGAGGRVRALLGDGLPSLEGERTQLVPLLSSIVHKRRARKVNSKRERNKKCEMVISAR
jgi:hypothetical protein